MPFEVIAVAQAGQVIFALIGGHLCEVVFLVLVQRPQRLSIGLRQRKAPDKTRPVRFIPGLRIGLTHHQPVLAESLPVEEHRTVQLLIQLVLIGLIETLQTHTKRLQQAVNLITEIGLGRVQ